MLVKSNITDAPLVLTRSTSLLRRAEAVIAGVTFSMMKHPDQFAPGEFPVYLERGLGAVVTDVDGRAYVDFICGLGANSLGHQHASINAAIAKIVPQGLLHSLPTELEVRVSEALLAATASTNSEERMVRLFKTGADATSAAVRLARHVTGRESIVTVGYNGWHDHFQYDTPGVPSGTAALTTRLPLFEAKQEEEFVAAIEIAGDKLAAVVLSVPYNRKLTVPFVQRVRETCSRHGILLVMDEIVTGFRLGPAGSQGTFGVSADLVCYSKALAAGMPLSALVGSKTYMSRMNELQVSTTFGGEMLSLAACEAALRVYDETDYYAHIARLGREVREGVNAVAEAAGSELRVYGYDPIPMFLFGPTPAKHVPPMKRFVGLMAQRGFILRRDVNFICAAHTSSQVQSLIAATAESLAVMAS